MNLLAISGSVRVASTNTVLLKEFAKIAAPLASVTVFDGLGMLPIFSPDLEGERTPDGVKTFCKAVSLADGLVISSPEYIHAIPGGLKNAIDWLVSREEIIEKPIALLHASHRGNEMLKSLRLVLRTVSSKFDEENFIRIHLMDKPSNELFDAIRHPDNVEGLNAFLEGFLNHIKHSRIKRTV